MAVNDLLEDIALSADGIAEACKQCEPTAKLIKKSITRLRKELVCGQCAHLIKTVEELERQLRIEYDTVDKMARRARRAESELDAQTSAQATRRDSVVAEGVTLPVGEKPALQRWNGGDPPQIVRLERTVTNLIAWAMRCRSLPMSSGEAEELLAVLRGNGGWVQDPSVLTHAVCRHGVTKGDPCPDCAAMDLNAHLRDTK